MKNLKKLFLFLNNNSFTVFEEKVLGLFRNFPKFPPEVSDFIVNFGPYLVLIGGVMGILSISTLIPIGGFSLYTFSPFISPFLPFLYLTVFGSVISGLMLIAAFDDLKKRELFGWKLVFWAANIRIIASLLSFDLPGAVVGALISWYILSQVKEKYS